MTYGKYFKHDNVPQTDALPGREAEMQRMASGGVGFKSDDWRLLNRFLMIGTEGGTYYEGEKPLTLSSAQAVLRCLNHDGMRVVNELVRISDGGLALSNSPAIFVLVLAYVHGDSVTRKAALAALPQVCRIGTHLFEFVSTLKAIKNASTMGRGVRTAIGKWYTDRKPNDLALQLIKYRSRFDYSHKDVLRLAHPKAQNAWQAAALGWAAGKVEATSENMLTNGSGETSYLIGAFELAQAETTVEGWTRLITEYNLPREALPTQALNHEAVWAAMLPKMPYMATLRNLATMTRIGMFEPFSPHTNTVLERLTNADQIRKSRVHPLSILMALKTYALGQGVRGSNTWTPNQKIVDALNQAFYASFINVEPVGKNVLIALDWSGSMTARISGMANMTGREAAAAIGLVYAKTNPTTHMIGFATTAQEIGFSSMTRIDDVIKWIETYGIANGTDCGVPFQYAEANQWDIDGVLMITDSQSWAGSRYASVAKKSLEAKLGHPVKWVNIQTTVQGSQIQDPRDKDGMEMAGFSPDFMPVANAFFRGEI